MSQRIVLSPTDMLLAQPLSHPVTTTAAAPPVMSAFVSLSKDVPGIPCFNCVGSPPSSKAYGITFGEPYLALTTNPADETYTFQDVSLTATCKILFHIIQNGATLITYTFTNISVQPSFVYLYYHSSPLPTTAVAGPATINANLVCPGTKVKGASESVYFY